MLSTWMRKVLEAVQEKDPEAASELAAILMARGQSGVADNDEPRGDDIAGSVWYDEFGLPFSQDTTGRPVPRSAAEMDLLEGREVPGLFTMHSAGQQSEAQSWGLHNAVNLQARGENSLQSSRRQSTPTSFHETPSPIQRSRSHRLPEPEFSILPRLENDDFLMQDCDDFIAQLESVESGLIENPQPEMSTKSHDQYLSPPVVLPHIHLRSAGKPQVLVEDDKRLSAEFWKLQERRTIERFGTRGYRRPMIGIRTKSEEWIRDGEDKRQ